MDRHNVRPEIREVPWGREEQEVFRVEPSPLDMQPSLVTSVHEGAIGRLLLYASQADPTVPIRDISSVNRARFLVSNSLLAAFDDNTLHVVANAVTLMRILVRIMRDQIGTSGGMLLTALLVRDFVRRTQNPGCEHGFEDLAFDVAQIYEACIQEELAARDISREEFKKRDAISRKATDDELPAQISEQQDDIATAGRRVRSCMEAAGAAIRSIAHDTSSPALKVTVAVGDQLGPDQPCSDPPDSAKADAGGAEGPKNNVDALPEP